jgi:hypothetical protein
MKRRLAIAAMLAGFALGALPGAALARDCGWRCGQWAQQRGVEYAQQRRQEFDDERRYRSRFQRGPEFRRQWRERENYGGPGGERFRALPPARRPGAEPLPDGQIWAIAKSRVPGRIVNARLHGSVYSFRILSNRGSIVDVVVDRYSGRIVSVRGGP